MSPTPRFRCQDNHREGLNIFLWVRVEYDQLETFIGVDQRIGAGSNPRISRVVSKPDRDHGMATTDNRNLGLTPVGTISHSNLSLGLYPIHIFITAWMFDIGL